MNDKPKLLKISLLLIVGIALSAILSLQAATNFFAVKQPIVATGIFPLDGFALERVAVRQMASEDQSEKNLQPLAMELEPIVLEAFRKEPLVPNALAILALAQEDQGTKENILVATSKINRRRLLLQTQLLSLYASKEDFDGTIGKLNEILAVHPEQKSVYLPALVQALHDQRAVDPLVEVLENSPDWLDQFLTSAAADKQSLDNLYRLRNLLDNRVEIQPETDRTIISRMANDGKLQPAYSLYQKFGVSRDLKTEKTALGKLDWRSEYPPFDWQLIENSDERVEVSSDGQSLKMNVKRGKGGVVAQRLVSVPKQPLTINILHSTISDSVLDDITFEWGCHDDDEPVLTRVFSKSKMSIAVDPQDDCPLHRIGINARAWSHKGDLSGRIDSVSIEAN